jgi:hypothetical protein
LELLLPLCQVVWHLGETDVSPTARSRLLRLVRRARDGAPLSFAFDRPRRPIYLADGIDRHHPAVLTAVGLNLPRLLQQIVTRGPADRDGFLHKLGSLARLALSAAAQKRDFLRRHNRRWPGFLLERARLVAVPLGLQELARAVMGQGLCDNGPGLEFARKVIERLEESLTRDGQASHLDAHLGAPFAEAESAGVTAWDAEAPPKQQLRASGLLHTGGGKGTATVMINAEAPPADELAEVLTWAWKHTEIGCVRLIRPRAGRQLTAPWEKAESA